MCKQTHCQCALSIQAYVHQNIWPTGLISYLINCCIKVAQGNKGHVILDCIHDRRHAQLQQFFGAEENMLHYGALQFDQASCFSGRVNIQTGQRDKIRKIKRCAETLLYT